jgi:hypothetical protein
MDELWYIYTFVKGFNMSLDYLASYASTPIKHECHCGCKTFSLTTKKHEHFKFAQLFTNCSECGNEVCLMGYPTPPELTPDEVKAWKLTI